MFSRFTFALVQAFRIGGGFYLHLPVVGIQGKLWDDSPLPDRLYPGPSDLRKKIDWISDLRGLLHGDNLIKAARPAKAAKPPDNFYFVL